MAEIAVSLLIKRLGVFIQKELHLLLGVQGGFEKVKTELEHMQAFLRKVDSMEDRDGPLKVWIKQVREVAYATEDAIDEFLLHLAHNHENELCATLKTISSFVMNVQARHRIASEIQSLQGRLVHISNNYKSFTENGFRPVSPGYGRSPLHGHSLVLDQDDLLGIEQPKRDLVSWLVDGSPWHVVVPVVGLALGWWGKSSSRAVVPVLGMGGSGKSTIVRQLYHDPNVKRRFKIQVWIKLSQSFDMEKVLIKIAKQIYAAKGKPVPEDVKDMQIEELRLWIRNLLLPEKYLVVLDDVWEASVWDAIQYAFPNNNYGSRLIITTRNENVAIASCKDGIFRVMPLSEEDSWSLFCRRTFENNECPHHLTEICQSIVRRLGGLPLAIVAISGVLIVRDVNMTHEWENILENLGFETAGNGGLEAINIALSLSFNDLPYHLKSCFLYMSVFPEDHLIECTRLVRLWVALGFVVVSEGDQRTPEEVAEEYLQELQYRSLIQRADTTSDGRVKTCRIHNLVRKMAVLKSREQNFAAAAARAVGGLRHISVTGNVHVGGQRRATRKLRSFLSFNVVNQINGFSSCGFRLLNALDLQDAPLEVFPNDVVNLFHLKYLSFRDTKIKEVPSSIRKLRNLETLDLKGTFVTELPSEIQELKKLRHLLAYRYEVRAYTRFSSKFGFKTSAKIGCLESLQKLCFIEASQGFFKEELGKLTQLRRLGIINFKREQRKTLCHSLQNLMKLRVLSVTSAENETIDLSRLSSPPPHLQRLYLTGRLERLPQWLSSHSNLAKIVFKSSELRDDPLALIQDLPSLVHVEFQQVFEGEHLFFRDGGFKKLRVLGLYELNKLKSVMIEQGAMPCLENLILHRCKVLLKVPCGMEHLSMFKKLEYFDMPKEFVPTLYPDAEVGDRTYISRRYEIFVLVVLLLIVLSVIGVLTRL